MSLLILLQTQGGGAQSVSVVAVALRMLAVTPAIVPGTATVTVAPTAITCEAVAPSVSPTVTIALTPTGLVLAAVAPAVASTLNVAVPAVTVTDTALAPVVTASVEVGVTPVSLALQATAPAIQGFIPVAAATLRLVALEPAVTGGGGPGLVAIPRKGGDSSTSIAYYPPLP